MKSPPGGRPPRWGLRAAIVAAFVLVVAGALLWVIRERGNGDATAAATPAAPRVMELAAVDLTTVSRGPLERIVPLSGTLRPLEQTLLKSKVAGELRALTVREGEAVRKGQVVARFDEAELQARVAEKRANFEAARAQLDLARKTWNMNADLLAKGFISQNAADNVANTVKVGEANLASALAQLDLVRNALADAIVRAPMDGVVAERFAQPGEKLPVDAKLLSIVDVDRMELEAEVPTSDIAFVKPGQAVEFSIEGIAGKPFQGRIERINPSADERSRAVTVYVVLPNPARELRGGMFAKGTLRLAGEEQATLMAVSALREERGEAVVYRLDGDTVTRQPVSVGMRDSGRGLVQVLGGLEPGVRVLNANLANVHPGDRVREPAAKPKG
jgi:RND family efflux transporter MFP subunit